MVKNGKEFYDILTITSFWSKAICNYQTGSSGYFAFLQLANM